MRNILKETNKRIGKTRKTWNSKFPFGRVKALFVFTFFVFTFFVFTACRGTEWYLWTYLGIREAEADAWTTETDGQGRDH